MASPAPNPSQGHRGKTDTAGRRTPREAGTPRSHLVALVTGGLAAPFAPGAISAGTAKNDASGLPVDDAFRACTIESLAAYEHHTIDLRAAQLTLHLGATHHDPVDGMFSFTPALPAGTGGPRFARPAYCDRRFINPTASSHHRARSCTDRPPKSARRGMPPGKRLGAPASTSPSRSTSRERRHDETACEGTVVASAVPRVGAGTSRSTSFLRGRHGPRQPPRPLPRPPRPAHRLFSQFTACICECSNNPSRL
jgi:hypothetical protein